MHAHILQEIGITTWHKRPISSFDLYIIPYILAPRCVVFLPLSKNYTNAQQAKIKLLTNKMLSVLNLNKQNISIISIYLETIDSLIKEPEQQIILNYLHHSKPKQVLSFLSLEANSFLKINNVTFTSVTHPEIILEQPKYKSSAYKTLLGLQDKLCKTF